MDSPTREGQLVIEELERVLSSASFARSDRLSKLLRFVVERHMEGRDEELKESLIGVEVFGRKPDYDPKLDSTVRTEAVRLRARLNKYYSTEGTHNPLVLELPKGGYVPRCRPRPVSSRVARVKPLWFVVGLTSLMVAVVGTTSGVRWVRSNEAPGPIAVLPLANLSQDPGSNYFVDGLTDEIIRQASAAPGLTVRSRTSSFALKGRPLAIHDAGSQLNVEYIVEGSVARNGPEVRITAQLLRVRDDVPIWTGTFNREMKDVLATQQDIARAIVNALQLKLGHGLRRYDTEAYDLYLRAQAAGDVRFPGDDQVIGLYEQAVGKDRSIAPAYAGLAVAYAFRSFTLGPRRVEELDKMRAAAERAMQLDSRLAEAHGALGAVYARNGQWDLAERSFRRAIELDPGLSTSHYLFGRFVLWPLGRMDEAVREGLAGTENDPLSPRARYELAEMLLSAGQYNRAAQYCEQLPPEMDSGSECLGRARLAQGRTADAIQVLASSATNNWGYLAYAYAKAGQREKAEMLMAAAPMRYPNQHGPFQYALVFAGFEDKDRTIEQLQRWTGVGPVRMGFTLNGPEFEFLRGDLRVKALRKQVGLPE
jgi:serine/threonine-protein kinase